MIGIFLVELDTNTIVRSGPNNLFLIIVAYHERGDVDVDGELPFRA
jgi:hypothetical protein